MEIVKGDKAEITVTTTLNDDLTVEIDSPDNISVVENDRRFLTLGGQNR